MTCININPVVVWRGLWWITRHPFHLYGSEGVSGTGEVKWSEVTQLCPTLCDPVDIACQAPLSMGFSRQEYWSGLPFPSPGDLPNPGIEPGSPALQADALSSEPPGKPPRTGDKRPNIIKDAPFTHYSGNYKSLGSHKAGDQISFRNIFCSSEWPNIFVPYKSHHICHREIQVLRGKHFILCTLLLYYRNPEHDSTAINYLRAFILSSLVGCQQ